MGEGFWEDGDLTPATTFGKLFTVVYIFAGLGIILGFIDIVAKETLISRSGGRSSGEDDQDAPGTMPGLTGPQPLEEVLSEVDV